MQNLAHSASFESLEKDAPGKAGIKHLGEPFPKSAQRWTLRAFVSERSRLDFFRKVFKKNRTKDES
jgi:hypothetical protein